MSRKALAGILGLLVLGGGVLSLRLITAAPRTLPTYFTYASEDVDALRRLEPTQQVMTADLYRWDEVAFDLMSENTLVTGFDPNTSKIYTYLLVAQRDAAYLSFNVKQKFAGSIAPVSREVLCIFMSSSCAEVATDEKADAYSEALAKIVVARIRARIAEDDRIARPYALKVGRYYWAGPEPMIGIADGSRKTWLIASGSQFRVPPPPAHDSAEVREQLAKVKEALSQITDQRARAVVSWAGGPGTETPPGRWVKIADDYMRERRVSLEKALLVRSTLAMVMTDAVIAVFDSKYTYWVKRPFMLDASIQTIMPTPNHPSYPAGHSALSAAAAAILSHYFPEATPTWQALAKEAGSSRVWGGIHYPMDDEHGHALGARVAGEALRQLSLRNRRRP